MPAVARSVSALALSLLTLGFGMVVVLPKLDPQVTAAPASRTQSAQAFANLPLSFEPNLGQLAPYVNYVARPADYSVFFTDDGAVFSMPGARPELEAYGPTGPGAALRMELVGADPVEPKAIDRLPGIVNYFQGSDPAAWHTSIPTYAGVRYPEVYSGIDLVFRGSREQFEYDFVVAPGADPNSIAIRFQGAESMRLDWNGNLVVETAAGKLVHEAPHIYQDVSDGRQEVFGRYSLEKGFVRFDVGAHDSRFPLVIDPLVYSTYLGGSAEDQGFEIAVDATGGAYITGQTFEAATPYPTTVGTFDTSHGGGFNDAFVTKLSADGSSLEYSTFLGGDGNENAQGIAVDVAGSAYVTGLAGGGGGDPFPTTAGAFSTTNSGAFDAFITKLSADGSSLEYSTLLGGTDTDAGLGIAVDGSGNAYVAGQSQATDFPTTAGSFSPTYNGGSNDAFVTKLAADGSMLEYSTFLGGSGTDFGLGISVDGWDSAYVTGFSGDATVDYPTTEGVFSPTHNGGSDAFVTKLDGDGSSLEFSTFLGGAGSDQGWGVVVDEAGRAYVAGETHESAGAPFPTTVGAFDTSYNGGFSDAFITLLADDGSSLEYSTFLGGTDADFGYGIATSSGRAFVTGTTSSADFPVISGAFDPSISGGFGGFVTRLAEDGSSLEYSSFSGGGSPRDLAVQGTNVYLTGLAGADFMTTAGAFDTSYNGEVDAFVAKLNTGVVCTDSNAFEQQQKEEKKAFGKQQKEDGDLFKSQDHSKQEKKAFHEQQEEDRRAFQEQQKEEKKQFKDECKKGQK